MKHHMIIHCSNQVLIRIKCIGDFLIFDITNSNLFTGNNKIQLDYIEAACLRFYLQNTVVIPLVFLIRNFERIYPFIPVKI